MNFAKKLITQVYNLERKQKNIIGFVLVGLITLFLFNTFIPLNIRNLKVVRRQLQVQTALLKAREDKLKTLVEFEKKFVEIQNRTIERKEMFFSSREANAFLKGLNNLAERTGGRIALIKPISEDVIVQSEVYSIRKEVFESKEEGDKFYYIKTFMQIKYEGEFKALLRLFERFRNYGKLIEIEQIRINADRQESNELNADFVLAIYKLDRNLGED